MILFLVSCIVNLVYLPVLYLPCFINFLSCVLYHQAFSFHTSAIGLYLNLPLVADLTALSIFLLLAIAPSTTLTVFFS